MTSFYRLIKQYWFYLLLLLVLIGGYYTFFYSSKINILQKDNLEFSPYDDKIASKCTIVSTSPTVKYQYTLNKGAHFPHAGLTIIMDSVVNLNGSDIVKFKIKLEKTGKVNFSFLAKTSNGKKLKIGHEILCNAGWNNCELDIADFNVPNWWIAENHPQDSLLKIIPQKITTISFTQNFFNPLGVQETIEVKDIIITSSKTVEKASFFSIILLSGISFFMAKLIKKRKKHVVLEYQSIDLPEINTIDLDDLNLKEIVEFINTNYYESKLTLGFIRKKLKITENNISKIIKTNFNLSFNDYVNQIRLEEAKKLLATTSLNVNEITELTGFGSVSSFNRIFKNKIGTTPSNFRKDKQVTNIASDNQT